MSGRFQQIVKRALAHFENVSGEQALSSAVHLAGVVVDGSQRCVRCGCVLTVRGELHYLAGVFVRRMEYKDGSASMVEEEGRADELCKRTK